MVRASAVVLCGALLAVPSTVGAQVLTERIRVHGGFVTEARPPPEPRRNDVFVVAAPELSALYGGGTSTFRLTYSLTGALHSRRQSTELANTLTLDWAFEPTRRSIVMLSVVGTQSSVQNILFARPASAGAAEVVPGLGTRLLRARVSQRFGYEVSPRVRFDQNADANAMTTLSPSIPRDALFGAVGAGLERAWPTDALGAEVSALYAMMWPPEPADEREFLTVTGAPRWRHDWSDTLSSLVAVGASRITELSSAPNGEKGSFTAPYARGALLYTGETSRAALTLTSSVTPNPMSGQLVHGHQATIQYATALSLYAGVFGGLSLGGLRGDVLDWEDRRMGRTFNALLFDADLMWQAGPLVQLFARYQFVAQVNERSELSAPPSFIRDTLLAGIVLSSRPPETVGRGAAPLDEAPTDLPVRVDRADDPRAQPEGRRERVDAEEVDARARPEADAPVPPGSKRSEP